VPIWEYIAGPGIEWNKNAMKQAEKHAELFMGRNDTDRNTLGGASRSDDGGDRWGNPGIEGGCDAVHHHAGCHDPVDRGAGDRGLVDQLARRMGPVLTFLFPRLDPDGEARKQISVNMIANILGLGWAATPAGLKAMEELKKVEEERGMGGAARQEGTASNEMCTFLIINISSLQLIPMNMIAYRSQYGSVNPTAIVGPALAATFISTVVAVIFCRIMDR
jgi:spore maturation protein A